MNRLKIVVAICGCFLLTTHVSANAAEKKGDSKANAKKAVLKNLKDPDSAKFGEYTQIDAKFACLTVNARNTYGGYTGDQQAFLGKYGKDWLVLGINEVSHGRCIMKLKKMSVEDGYKAEDNDNHEQIQYAEPIYLDCTVSYDHNKPIPKNKDKMGYELGKTLNELIGHKNSFQLKIDAKTGKITHTREPKTVYATKEFNSKGVVNSKYIRYMHSYDFIGDTLNNYYEINRNNLSVKQTSYIESSNSGAFYEIMEKKGNCKATTAVYIDKQQVLNSSIAGKEGKELLAVRVKKYQDEINKRQAVLLDIKTDLEKTGMSLSDSARASKENSYRKDLDEFKQFTKNAQDDLDKMNKVTTDKILDELESVAHEYGRKNGYTFIYDRKEGVHDVTDDLIKQFDAKRMLTN